MYWKRTLKGSVVDPLEVVGADTEEFSVFVQVMVSAVAAWSKNLTSESCPSAALVVVMVIVTEEEALLVTLNTP